MLGLITEFFDQGSLKVSLVSWESGIWVLPEWVIKEFVNAVSGYEYWIWYPCSMQYFVLWLSGEISLGCLLV